MTTQAPDTPTTPSLLNPLSLPSRALELASMLTPAWDQLLVVRDPHSKQIGVGIGGRAIVAADTSTDYQPLRSGTVLKAGPNASSRYPTGTRIAFGEYALTTLGFTADVPGDEDGPGAEVGLLTSTEVMCVFDASPEVLPRPLAVEGAQYARATYGAVLVERSTAPLKRRRIIVPGGIAGSIRTLEARVVDVSRTLSLCRPDSCKACWENTATVRVPGALHHTHPLCDRCHALYLEHGIDGLHGPHKIRDRLWERMNEMCPFRRDDLVLLGPSVGRAIPFGIRQDRVLWSCLPGQILCHIAAPAGQQDAGVTSDDEETPLAYRGRLRPMDGSGEDVQYDEGDRRAPR